MVKGHCTKIKVNDGMCDRMVAVPIEEVLPRLHSWHVGELKVLPINSQPKTKTLLLVSTQWIASRKPETGVLVCCTDRLENPLLLLACVCASLSDISNA